jgi:hypothetical protein
MPRLAMIASAVAVVGLVALPASAATPPRGSGVPSA